MFYPAVYDVVYQAPGERRRARYRHGVHHRYLRSRTSGTGSKPLLPPGPQLPTRNNVIQPPGQRPCRAIAS